jgi:hypothetical protein
MLSGWRRTGRLGSRHQPTGKLSARPSRKGGNSAGRRRDGASAKMDRSPPQGLGQEHGPRDWQGHLQTRDPASSHAGSPGRRSSGPGQRARPWAAAAPDSTKSAAAAKLINDCRNGIRTAGLPRQTPGRQRCGVAFLQLVSRRFSVTPRTARSQI